jgi:hypothetical protein
MRTLSLELKLAAGVLALCAGAALAGARLTHHVYEDGVERASDDSLRGAAAAFDAQERSDIEKLGATLDALLANPELRGAYQARDRARLLEAARPLFETMRDRDRITHWYFIEPDQRVFLRVHRPELFGDTVDRTTLARARDTGELGAGKELGRTAFALRAVRPWFQDGKLVGYMELAEEIDHFLSGMKSRTGDEYGLLVMKKHLDEQRWAQVLGPRANTWNDRPDVVVVDTTTFSQGIFDYSGDVAAIPAGGKLLGEVLHAHRAFVRGVFPVRDAADRTVGALFVLHDFTGQHGALQAAAVRSTLLLVGLLALLAVAIVTGAHLLVFRRLADIRERLEADAAAQRLPHGRVVHLASDDEVSRLEGLLERALFPSRRRDEAPRSDDPPRSEPPAAGSNH